MRIFSLMLVLLAALSMTYVFAQEMHLPLRDIVFKYVHKDGINYAGLKSERVNLEAYLLTLNAEVPPTDDRSLATKAFRWNAYNAFTLKLVMHNHPSKVLEICMVAILGCGIDDLGIWLREISRIYLFDSIF